MSLQIIDASVAIKWFLDHEEGRPEALQLLDRIKDSPQQFAVPELFFNEMFSVFCRLLSKSQPILDYLQALQNLGMIRLGNGMEMFEVAIDLATRFHLSGYDAVYAANATLVKGVWITADAKAHRKIERLGISRLLTA